VSRIRGVSLAALLLILGQTGRAEAINTNVWISPGVKLAYTIGVGFTWGFEVSVVWSGDKWDDVKKMPVGLGFVVDLDWSPGLFKMHLGAEVVGPFFGMEVGPTLVRERGRNYFGLGLTPWVSSYMIPYYTYTAVFGRPKNLHELGAYLKLHINTDGDFGSSGDWDD